MRIVEDAAQDVVDLAVGHEGRADLRTVRRCAKTQRSGILFWERYTVGVDMLSNRVMYTIALQQPCSTRSFRGRLRSWSHRFLRRSLALRSRRVPGAAAARSCRVVPSPTQRPASSSPSAVVVPRLTPLGNSSDCGEETEEHPSIPYCHRRHRFARQRFLRTMHGVGMNRDKRRVRTPMILIQGFSCQEMDSERYRCCEKRVVVPSVPCVCRLDHQSIRVIAQHSK